MSRCTEDGSVKAIFQFLYGQYHNWELHICVRPENQSFCRKKQPITFSHGHVTHSAKIVLIVWPKIPQMPENNSAQNVCPSPNV